MVRTIGLTKFIILDMVGKVENVQELIITNKDEVRKSRFKFEISDGRLVIKKPHKGVELYTSFFDVI